MLEILRELWRCRQLIALSITGAKVSTTMLALQNIDQQVDALVDKYAKAKTGRSLGPRHDRRGARGSRSDDGLFERCGVAHT
jgi:hypothetical protein